MVKDGSDYIFETSYMTQTGEIGRSLWRENKWREMSKLKNKNVIQWFICLVRRDMESYTEDKGEKRKLYQFLKRKLNFP